MAYSHDMKIAAFDLAGRRRHGLVIDGQVHPLPANTDIFKILAEDSGSAVFSFDLAV